MTTDDRTRTAATTTTIHPLLAERWSPRAFDLAPVSDADVRALLEAARWAPSAMNQQPWRFLIGREGVDGADRTHKGILDSLAGGNQVWASAAPVLVAALVQVENEDGSERAVGPYELGLAVAQLTVQAHALGLHVHQMAGFDAGQIIREFDVPAGVRPVVVLAIGRLGDPESLPAWAAALETAPRERLPLAAIAYAGEWGTPVAL